MTTGAFEEDRDKRIRSGMDDFLAKPLRIADLELMPKNGRTSDGNKADASGAAAQPKP